jgi:hypothetical protein
MATWQEGNGGGLLAGLGRNNENAPQASSVNTTLGLIQGNNEFARAGGNNVALQGLQGLNGLSQQHKEQQAAERGKQFKQLYGQAFASGDREGMRNLAAQFPDQFESVQKGLGFIDQEQRDSIGSLAATARIAAKSPESMATWLQSNQQALARVGARPEDVAKMYQSSPEEFGKFVDHLGLSALGPDKYYDLQDKAEGRKVTMRGQNLTAETARRGQDITVRGQNISAQNAALDRQIKQAEVQDKVLDRQIARETNVARLGELQQKQIDARQKAEDARTQKTQQAQQTYDTFSTALGTIADLKTSPGLRKAVGFNSAFLTVPGTDAADFEAKLDTFKAQTFLPMVQSMKGMGALSDAEGKKLTDAVGALSPKMSQAEFIKSLDRIEGQLQGKLTAAQKTYGIPVQTATPTQAPAPQQQTGFSSLWGE